MKVTSSVVAGTLSGAAGDVVAATVRGVQYVRRRVIPFNPQSTAQTLVRDAWTRTVRCYQALSGPVKEFLATLGKERQLVGFNVYIKANRHDEAVSFSHPIMPANTHLQSVLNFAAAAGAGAGEIDLTWDPSDWTPADFPMIYCRLKVPDKDYYEAPWSAATFEIVEMMEAHLTITGLNPAAAYTIAMFGNRPEYEIDEETIPNAYGGGAFAFATAGAE